MQFTEQCLVNALFTKRVINSICIFLITEYVGEILNLCTVSGVIHCVTLSVFCKGINQESVFPNWTRGYLTLHEYVQKIALVGDDLNDNYCFRLVKYAVILSCFEYLPIIPRQHHLLIFSFDVYLNASVIWQIYFFWQFVENYCAKFKDNYIPRPESSVVRRRTTKQCKPHRKTIDSNKPGQTILRFWLFCCTFCSLFGFDISENIIRDTFSIQF